MTQVTKRQSAKPSDKPQDPTSTAATPLPLARNPRQAQRKRAAIDRLLDTELFKALADPTRAKLLACLVKCGRACSVSEVADCCAVDFSVVARHLAQLARVGILSAEKKGRTMWYTPCCVDLASRFRDSAAAIEQWSQNATCDADGAADCCGNG